VRRALASGAAPLVAPAAGSNPKVAEIVVAIGQLTLLETADLVAQLKARFNIGDVPVFGAGTGAAPGAAAAAAAAAPAAVRAMQPFPLCACLFMCALECVCERVSVCSCVWGGGGRRDG
jgi:hypothetical protein